VTPATSDAAVREAIDLNRVNRKLDGFADQVTAAQQQADAAQTELQLVESAIQANQLRIAQERIRLANTAATAYQRHGTTIGATLSIPSLEDLAAADVYAGAAGNIDTTQLVQLTNTENALEKQRDQRAAEYNQLSDAASKLVATQQQLEAQRQQDQAELDQVGAVPVMGAPELTAAQLAAWYRSTGAVANLAGTSLDDLTQMYIQEGDDEHVRGDIAFAQSMIETGSLSVDAGNNYSGIGACDTCAGGFVFATPLDGVRAQIQLLRNYADPDSRADNLAHAPDPGLYGSNSGTAAQLYDSFPLKGKVPLWNQMGHGNWATDPTYAGKVLAMYDAMLAFAGQQH
jgi:hypothetical protein